MDNSNLHLVMAKNHILAEVQKIKVKSQISDRLRELRLDVNKHKHDTQFLILICELIEYLVDKKDNIDKLEILFLVFDEFIVLTEEEKKIISDNINFICTNKLIKKVSYYRLFCSGIYELFFKKK